ncbi:MAG: gluconolaconase [Lachnospiraceae bacterium]|nr:gluconolaconase [Lachnospiraceae bacterium]
MWYGKESVYKEKFQDPTGIFFTEEVFPGLVDKKDDVSDILQMAVDRLIAEQSYGILYIPEGEYRIKNMVKIPPSVRLIGYGKKRPVFVLPAGTEGFGAKLGTPGADSATAFTSGYPGAKYMFWFIGEKDTQKEEPADANAATFYSAISNIDFRIEENNPSAICIRAHFAQHGFVSHCHFDLGDGLAGLFDVGNEMEDLTFTGGAYGIVCRMCSPGWPFALLDSVFEGQKKAAILSGMTGFTGFRLRISDTPKAFDLYVQESWEKLYLEDCIFENIHKEAITCYQTDAVIQQTNIKRLRCANVPVLIKHGDSGRVLCPEYPIYEVEDYAYGYMLDDSGEAKHQEIQTISPLAQLTDMPQSDIPPVPPMEKWVSVLQYGAKGDGVSDDTKAIQTAVEEANILYFPQGIYKITDTVYLRKNCCLYGLSPITTQIVIEDDTPAFAGFGAPKALVETAEGISVYFNGIGIDTAGKNPRAAGVKWMADASSYMNDVKFVGGHGLMFRDGRNAYGYLYNATRTADYDPDRVWDYQYSSLWVTNSGGGIFKDIWSASPYAEAGIAITNTDTPGRMYAISLEHHVRCEMKLNGVKNWSFYAFQTEEEKAEGMECLPIELVLCENILFANLFMFRVIAVDRPYEVGIRLWDCEDVSLLNVHNKAQMQYVFTLTLRDETTGFYAKSPEYARLYIKGGQKETKLAQKEGNYEIIGENCVFAQGAAFDEDGNLYWCDKIRKKIYKYDRKEKKTRLFLDIHFMPSALAVDTEGHLLVAVDYSELKKTVPGQPFAKHDTSNFHPFFSWFYKRGEKAYAVSLENPYDSMVELKKLPADECRPERVFRPAHLDYYGMMKEIAEKPIIEYYLAPDGKTALEGCIDLARSLSLKEAVLEKPFVMMNDSARKAFMFDVTVGGNLQNGRAGSAKGQYGGYLDEEQILWVVDDKLYGYQDGEIVRTEEIPKDAYIIVENKGARYLLGRSRVYRLLTT